MEAKQNTFTSVNKEANSIWANATKNLGADTTKAIKLEGTSMSASQKEAATVQRNVSARLFDNQEEALKDADFVYAKNWSSYSDYGKILRTDPQWMVTSEKMKKTNNAKFMHCLPIRRNIVVSDDVLDSPNSLVIEQANNRTFATQVVLKKILENG